MEEVLPVFLEHGLLGACVVVLAIVVWRLYRAQAKVNEARIAEAKAVTDKLLEISERWIDALGEQSEESEKIAGCVETVERRLGDVLSEIQRHDRETRGGHR